MTPGLRRGLKPQAQFYFERISFVGGGVFDKAMNCRQQFADGFLGFALAAAQALDGGDHIHRSVLHFPLIQFGKRCFRAKIFEPFVPHHGMSRHPHDGRVIVRVGDSGTGIAMDALPSIFEPFFSTKNRGTGMGLPVAQRIARMYEGSMEVECSSSAGTIFRLEFPACS